MTTLKLAIKSFRYYFRSHLSLMSGVIISTMVITGALIVGDSVKYSLENIAMIRLGHTTQTLTSVDRYFSTELVEELNGVPVLRLDGSAVSDGGKFRLNKVQVLGIDSSFSRISDAGIYKTLSGLNVAIGFNTAERLNLKPGDGFLLRLDKASPVPRNAPFVAEEGQLIALRVNVARILSKEETGAFNLRNSQTAPYNVFVNLSELQKQNDLKERVNVALFTDSKLSGEDIKGKITLRDAGLRIGKSHEEGIYRMTSDRIFIEEKIADAFPNANRSLTYFVNAISAGHKSTPYSFVGSMSNLTLRDDEIDVNRWLADDLNLKPGDTLTIKYFVVGPLRDLSTDSATLVVRQIHAMDGLYADPALMPDIPGLSDVGNCSDWETGVPVNLDAIRDKDEDYWDEYKGAPKAFISYNTAVKLWSNRFGIATALYLNEPKTAIAKQFTQHIDAADLGLIVTPVKQNALFAARNGVDFGQLFIGLSFFILLSGFILVILLVSFHLSKREEQIGTLSAMGIPPGQIKYLLVLETGITLILGVLAGLLFSVGYNRMIFVALNRVWNDIVRTEMLVAHIDAATLLVGALVSLFTIMLTIYFTFLRTFKKNITQQQRAIKKTGQHLNTVFIFTGWILSAGTIILIVILIISGHTSDTGLWFSLGGALMAGVILLFRSWLIKMENSNLVLRSYFRLSLKNMTQNRGRSMSVIILFTLGTFIVVSTGLNRKDMSASADARNSGTGGSLFFTETTIPVLKNLNSSAVQHEEGFTTPASFIQFRKAEGDDASCLNLNRITNPAILGVEPDKLDGRFTFVTKDPLLDQTNPWRSLNKDLGDDIVPAIADQTVILWGLGKEIGDTLEYQTATGDRLKLKLIGGLANSVFQGYVIISNQNFLKYFPSSSGSNIMLVNGEKEQAAGIKAELEQNFRDYGIELISSTDKLNQFYSIENTYLAIFLILGVLGLILGIIGLGIILARSVFERKKEISLLQSLGFKSVRISSMLAVEYLILLFAGLITGIVTATVATLPSLISAGTQVSFRTVFIVLSVLVLCGLIIILTAAGVQVRKKDILAGLRYE
ncbi:FtsX-like permease family protein [Saccharicrinis sp. FJH54]|uniref:FtsX-like permease family protein n=1 Tax=Saccharicrinis sp. FJH54 TaxID=3344665 RepID=UPI0035D3E881